MCVGGGVGYYTLPIKRGGGGGGYSTRNNSGGGGAYTSPITKNGTECIL